MILLVIVPFVIAFFWLTYFLMLDRKTLPVARYDSLSGSESDNRSNSIESGYQGVSHLAQSFAYQATANENGRRIEAFNSQQAKARLGRRVRTITEIAGIPKGTHGRVMNMDKIENDAFELIIEWDLRIEGKRQHDWFTKERYEQSLVELSTGGPSDHRIL